MKKKVVFGLTAICCSLIISCKIGSDDGGKEGEVKEATELMVNSAQFAPFEVLKKNNIPYDICKDETEKVIYIQTKNRMFITSDSVSVGMHLSEVLTKVNSSLIEESGWAYVLPLESGWNAAFGLSENGYEMAKDSTVKWIFRRSNFPKK